MKSTMRLLLFIVASILFLPGVKAQGLCFNTRISTAAGSVGDTATLQLSAAGFTDITSFQWSIIWDSAALELVNLDVINSPLEFINYSLLAAPTGILRMMWYDLNTTGVTLADNTPLFTMKFKILTDNPGLYSVQINPEQIPAYEVTQKTVISMPFVHIPGAVSVGPAVQAGPEVSSVCVTGATCTSPAGTIFTGISGGVQPYSFSWVGPGGFASFEQDLNGVGPGQYTLSFADSTGTGGLLLAVVPGTDSVIYVHTDSATAAYCGFPNGCIAVSGYSGLAPYTYEWSDNGSALPSRCDFAPGTYTVSVTDANGCSTVEDFSVGNKTLFDIELDSLNADCRFGQSGAILSTVSGGVGPYAYAWSNGLTVAAPDSLSPGTYTVTVTDSLGCSNSKSVTVRDYGTFDWIFYQNATCTDPVNGPYWKITGADFANRAAFPVKLEWSTGTVQVFDELEDNLYAGQFHLPEGLYGLKISDADGCTVDLERRLSCTNQLTEMGQKGPYFEIVNNSAYLYLNGQLHKDSCAEIVGYNLLNVKELHLGVEWFNNELEYSGLKYLSNYLPGISMNDFLWEPGSQKISFDWKAPEGESITYYYGIHLFNVCFDTMVTYKDRWVGFTDSEEPASVIMNNGAHAGFIGRSLNLRSEASTDNKVCDYDVQLQNCIYDGVARIHVKLCSGSYWGSDNFLEYNGEKQSDAYQLLFAQHGDYKIRPGSGLHWYLFARIPNYTLEQPCVWPGDADNNNAVNHYDAMYLVYGNYTGAPRIDASLEWEGQDGIFWSNIWWLTETALHHIDTDGNGQIDRDDTLAIVQNYNRTVNPRNDNPYAMPGGPSIAIGEKLHIPGDTVMAGADINLPVYLDSILPNQSNLTLGGFAFSVSYDTLKFPQGLWFEPLDHWPAGQIPAGMNSIQRCFPGQQRLDVGVGLDYFAYRVDTIIGYLHGFIAPATQTGAEHTRFYVTNAIALANLDELLTFDSFTIELTVIDQGVSIATHSVSENQPLKIAPNPAADYIRITIPDQPVSHLYITDLTGRIKYYKPGPIEGGFVGVPVRQFAAGQYLVKAQTEHGVLTGRFIHI